jgi:hypothetical protein
MRFWRDPAKRADRLRQRHGLIVKGKHISCPPHYAPPNNDYDPPHHDYEHGFPLIRSLRASTQRSTSVLFSFVLSLLIVVGSFAVRQSKTILARSCAAGRAVAEIGRTPIALPVNVDLILFLILTVINWVEGVLKFTYVESISDTCQKCLFPVNSRPLYH